MAVSAKWYGLGLKSFFNKEVDWDTDTIKVALVTSSYSPDQDTHDEWADVSAYEVTGDGYTAGGATMTCAAPDYTAGTNVIKLDADDVTWSTSTITARYAIIYDDTHASKRLLGYVDFGADVTSTGGDFTIAWNAGGVFTNTPA